MKLSKYRVKHGLYSELGVTHYKCNVLCNNITFTVTSNITRYMTK